MPSETSPHHLKDVATSRVAPYANIEAVQVSLLDILIALAEHKRTIFSVTAFSMCVAVILAFALPQKFTATVTLLPPQQGSSVSTALVSQLGSLGGMANLATSGLGLKSSNDMYVSMLKSRIVEDSVIDRFGLKEQYHCQYMSDARRRLESRTYIDGNGRDGLIHISVEDRDAARSAALTNGYVEQFRKLSDSLAITEAAQRRLFFEQQLQQAKDSLANAEEALRKTEQSTGLIQLDSQARALIESAAALRAQITAKEVQIQSLRTFATNENAQLVQAQQELEGLRIQLAKLGGSEEMPGEGLIIPKGRVTGAGLEYVRKLRDVKYFETIFDILARQYEMAKLDEAKQGALIQVVDPAVIPDKRSFPKRTLLIGVVTGIGIVIGIFLSALQAGLEKLREDPDSAKKLSTLRRLCTIWRPVVK